jgi:TPR repeat protein
MGKIFLTAVALLMLSTVGAKAQTASDFRADAEQGDVDAQVGLGNCYAEGSGGSFYAGRTPPSNRDFIIEQ